MYRGTLKYISFDNITCWYYKEKLLDEINCLSIANLRIFNFELNQETKLQMINSSDKIIDQVEYYITDLPT
jgi:hypothetical protein